MTHRQEAYVLDSLDELNSTIRSPAIKQLVKETHENNIMLKQIIKVINTYIANHHNENNDDFNRNVLANFVSNVFDFNKMFKQ